MTKPVKLGSSSDLRSRQYVQLAKSLRSRLKPSEGARPGRPSDPTWNQHGKLPMSGETVEMLQVLASELSTTDRKISPMQVAAHLLELQLKRYVSTSIGGSDAKSKCA